ncbi:MAG: acyl-CoA dehydrogenase family protein [Spirochaetaceae bacterium]|nr:acyl-CoA dehydrogenase family protein [Spirochaetaceae bacterium]
MENFLLDNEDILFHLEHMDIDRIITQREDNFKDAGKYAYAPIDLDDAKDSYKKVLNIIGEICGDSLAPLAAEIDEEGVKLVNGEVQYAKGTKQLLDIFAKADLMGFSLPRKYNGLNFPAIMLSVAAEIVSRADGSFLNFGLQQDIGETLNKFGSEKQKAEVLPKLASGELGCAMILTEPDAGSDLQAVNLRAHQAASGQWFLNGVKRFITNGNGEIGLVLARSEDGQNGARGLSFFLYKRDEHMKIRRLEHKLGIHGSPTCELQFDNAPVTLVGERKRGLSKYTMWLMNSARLGIAAQALGVAEAAYREADKYAAARIQFGKTVREFPPVFEMLTEMKISIEAGRVLLYETAKFVDLKEGLEEMQERYPDRKAEFKTDHKRYSRLAGMFTPLVKAYNTEMVNKVAYDNIQIHGGTGYMQEFDAERHYRDARITSIYEGTTQLQIVAAIGGVTSGTAISVMDDYEGEDFSHAEDLHQRVLKARHDFEKTLVGIKDLQGADYVTYHSRRLVEMATDIIIGYLFLRDSAHSERKLKVAEIFIEKMVPRVKMNMSFILEAKASLLYDYKEVIG